MTSLKNIPVEKNSSGKKFCSIHDSKGILLEFQWNLFTINRSTSFQWNLIFSSGIRVEFLCPLESSGIPLSIFFGEEQLLYQSVVFRNGLFLGCREKILEDQWSVFKQVRPF